MVNKIINEETYYCFDCKKYFSTDCSQPQGFNTCDKCGKMNVLRLVYDNDGTLYIEEQDNICINVAGIKGLNRYIKIINNLVKQSQKRDKTIK